MRMRDRASGRELARSEGSIAADHVWEISEGVARDTREAASPRQRFSVKARTDHLVIDTAVCDYSGTFKTVSLSGGASPTISFSPTSSNIGMYTYSGQVAGAQASGAPTYLIDLKPDRTGTRVIEGVYSVTSPMGIFSAAGPETMVLSPPGNACGRVRHPGIRLRASRRQRSQTSTSIGCDVSVGRFAGMIWTQQGDALE